MRVQDWVKLPSHWIEKGGLKEFDWHKGQGSSECAALMVLVALAHRMVPESGKGRLTYNEIADATSLSRTKIADALRILETRNIIRKDSDKQSCYRLVGYAQESGWAILPARRLYEGGSITVFKDFHLRKVTELNALKAYLSFVARRDRSDNLAHMTYEQIEEYAGIQRNRIKSAISLLVSHNLIHVEHLPRTGSEHGIASAYRLAHYETRRHMGTTGRRHVNEVPF